MATGFTARVLSFLQREQHELHQREPIVIVVGALEQGDEFVEACRIGDLERPVLHPARVDHASQRGNAGARRRVDPSPEALGNHERSVAKRADVVTLRQTRGGMMGAMVVTRSWLGVMLIASVACARSASPICGDRTCPEGTTCGELRGEDLCLLPGQDTACSGLEDGRICVADDVRGICDTGLCLSGCGDGRRDADEECDDGNFKSRDGCSSRCVAEVLTWNEWQAPRFARTDHRAAYDVARSSLVVVGGYNQDYLLDQWQRGAAGEWTQLAQTPIGRRIRAAVAYDSIRERIVLFGGFDGTVDRADTWEYDGATWIERTFSTSPPAREGAAMVFDSQRGKMVLFGGSWGHYDDTWEYDGNAWTKLTTSPTPLGRRDHVMAWDDTRKRVVMFGGVRVGILGDTWEYDAGTWTQVTPPAQPKGRFDASMAFLPGRGRVVLFGGKLVGDNLVTTAGDTWEFDGTTWYPIPTPVAPSARSAASLTLDAARGLLVLVGGATKDGESLEEVWEYRANATWGPAHPRLYPRSRVAATLVYDETRKQLLLFGGIDNSNNSFDETWAFDGASWKELTGTMPSARFTHSMAYDAAASRTVMFGGRQRYGSQYWSDTCEWGGQSWNCAQLAGPSPREFPALADVPGEGVVLFGGVYYGNGSEEIKADTWRYAAGAWTQVTTSAGPPADLGAAMTFDPLASRTVLFGFDGVTRTFDGSSWGVLPGQGPSTRRHASMMFDSWRERVVLYGGTHDGASYNDVWELVDDKWRAVELPGLQPTARYAPAVAMLPSARALVLFGGSATTGVTRGDTWLLRYQSATLDEICDNQEDDDDDLHVDLDDPDCGDFMAPAALPR